MRRSITIVLVLASFACRDPQSDEDGDEQGESNSGTSTSESAGTSESESTSGSAGTSESESTSESETGEPPPPRCNPDAFTYAFEPQPYVAGLLVPIDVLSLSGDFEFRAAQQVARGVATMVFQVGETGGMPVLDLRQNPNVIELDGEQLAPSEFPMTPLGPLGNLEDSLRVIERELEPCSIHELHVEYWLDTPLAPLGGHLAFFEDPARVSFDFFMTDAEPGRYLEAWLPANMPWDRHPIELALRVTESEVEHVLISNGSVEQLGDNDWLIDYDDTTNAVSPMLLIKGAEGLLSSTVVHPVHGVDVPWDIYVYEQVNTPAVVEAALVQHFDTLAELGPYPHERLTVYLVLQDLVFGAYRGGVTVSILNLRNALFDLWWGRAIEPATYADAWLGWAWSRYVLEQFVAEPLDPAEPAARLYDPRPFARVPPLEAFEFGPRVFAAIAALMGANALRIAMRELIDEEGVPRSLSTAELEQHLFCASGEAPELRQIFWRWVYGNAGGEPEPLPPCE